MRWRRTIRVHPECAAAAAALLAWPLALGGALGHAAPAADDHAHGAATAATVLSSLPHWTVMCVAMMVPIALPAVRHVGRNSLRRRRGRAMLEFLIGYLTVWLLFGAVAIATVPAVRPALPILVAVAVLWPFTPWHRRMRGGCHRSVALPPSGLSASRADVRFGLQHGVFCVGACAPAMLVMAVLLHGGIAPMLAVAALVAAARLLPARYLGPPRPLLRRWRSAWRSVRAPSPLPRRDPSGERWSPGLRAGAG